MNLNQKSKHNIFIYASKTNHKTCLEKCNIQKKKKKNMYTFKLYTFINKIKSISIFYISWFCNVSGLQLFPPVPSTDKIQTVFLCPVLYIISSFSLTYKV